MASNQPARFFIPLLIGILLALALPAAAQFARYETPGPNHFAGYLTMNGGKGGMSWAPGAKTDDPGGPAPAAASDQALMAGFLASKNAGTRQSMPSGLASHVFTSEPLPRTLHLHPAHEILLELRITRYTSNGYYDPCYYAQSRIPGDLFNFGGGQDPFLEVSLKMGESLVGGSYGSPYIDWWATGRPGDPPGYATCRFVFHPEVATIPAGSVLTLRIDHIRQSQGFQYGLAGDHASILYLPFFSDEDWLFRDPGRAATSSGAASPPSTTSAGLAPAGLLGLCLLRPLRAKPALPAFLLLAAALSGCLGSEGTTGTGGQQAAPTGGTAVQTIVRDDNGTLSQGENGSVIGQVYDDLNLPLKGVHVSLLSTNFFTTTGGGGQFVIKDVPPGRYQMRFDLSGYKSLETQVTVQSRSATRLTVNLAPLQDKPADDRPHLHDYWAGESKKTVMQARLPYTCTASGVNCYAPYTFTLPSPKGNEYSSILPGTYVVEVTLKWDTRQIPYNRVALAFSANHDRNTWNSSFLAPRASGVPFSIQTTWEMHDPGHQSWSSWEFNILPVYEESTQPLDQYGGAPEYEATVVLHRGVVPLEPAHPDHWLGNRSFVAGRLQTTLYHSPFNTAFMPLILALCKGLDQPCYMNQAYFGAPKLVIPPETTWIDLYLNQSADSLPHFDWNLRYRPAGTTYYDYEYEKMATAPPPVRRTPLSTHWRLPVKPGEADPVYATQSAWRFVGQPADETAAALDYGNPAQNTITVVLTVIPHRDAMP